MSGETPSWLLEAMGAVPFPRGAIGESWRTRASNMTGFRLPEHLRGMTPEEAHSEYMRIYMRKRRADKG